MITFNFQGFTLLKIMFNENINMFFFMLRILDLVDMLHVLFLLFWMLEFIFGMKISGLYFFLLITDNVRFTFVSFNHQFERISLLRFKKIISTKKLSIKFKLDSEGNSNL